MHQEGDEASVCCCCVSQAAVERFMPEEAEAQRAVEECEALKAACDQALQAGGEGYSDGGRRSLGPQKRRNGSRGLGTAGRRGTGTQCT